MFDTMTFTKTLGALCGALLVFLLGKWAAESLYHVGGHHGEEVASYVIEVADAEEATDDAPTMTVEEHLAAGDASAGERLWSQCRACHQLEQGANAVGPYLYGVVGRDVGTAEGYNYSGALSDAADVWTPENLFAFLENPAGYAPGTSMSYRGMPSPEDRANLIAFLDQTDE
ncbi:c-type cytochrome [Citreimonas sp.]|uniref:c-type cytochrome n=1 Tax=Citreimonas sp. TaxID=3036715 RepID=UPI0040581469